MLFRQQELHGEMPVAGRFDAFPNLRALAGEDAFNEAIVTDNILISHYSAPTSVDRNRLLRARPL
jgi:hypothetical protein